MALSHTGMALVALCSEQFATNLSVTNVGFGTMTMDGRGIATEDAQVVQHSGFFEELNVNRQFLVLLGYLQGPVGHLPAML